MVGTIASEIFLNRVKNNIGNEMSDNLLQVAETPVGKQIVDEVSSSSRSIVAFVNEQSVPIIVGLAASVITYSIMKVMKMENSAVIESLIPTIPDADFEEEAAPAKKPNLKELKVKAQKKV